MLRTIENVATWVVTAFVGLLGAWWVLFVMWSVYTQPCDYSLTEVLMLAWIVTVGVLAFVDFIQKAIRHIKHWVKK